MKKSALASLSHAEQEQIQVLCSSQPYAKVVDFLATPRTQGGFGLKTSQAALCRFVTHYNSAPEQAAALGQLAKAVLLRAHPAGQDALAAVVTILQQDILYRLSLRCSMDSVLPMLRLLHRLHLDLFKLDKRQALQAPAMEKELEQMAAMDQELGETDCEILEEPPVIDYCPPSAHEAPRPYLDPAEGRLWPDQAPRVPDDAEDPSTNRSSRREEAQTNSAPTESEALSPTSAPTESTINPIVPMLPIIPIPPTPSTADARNTTADMRPSTEPEYSTPDSTNSTENARNSTYSTKNNGPVRPELLEPSAPPFPAAFPPTPAPHPAELVSIRRAA